MLSIKFKIWKVFNVILLSCFLFFTPFFAFASDSQVFYDNSTGSTLYVNQNTPLRLYWQSTNNFYSIGYWQMQVWFDSYGSQECFSIQGPGALGSFTGNVLELIDLSGHTDISEIDIVQSDSNSVDGNNCFNGSNQTYTIVMYENSGGPAILIGLPVSTSSTSIGTTFLNNPNQDLFNGFILFFGTIGGIIWFFRRPRQ